MGVIFSGFENLIAKVEEVMRAEATGDTDEAKSTWDRGSEDTREAYVVDADTPRGSSSTVTFPLMLLW